MPDLREQRFAFQAIFGVTWREDASPGYFQNGHEMSLHSCMKEMEVLFDRVESYRRRRLELSECFAFIHEFVFLISRYSDVLQRNHILHLQVWFYALLADIASSQVGSIDTLKYVSTFLNTSTQALGSLQDKQGQLQ